MKAGFNALAYQYSSIVSCPDISCRPTITIVPYGGLMLWTKYFIPTAKEDPADAEVISHKLMVRAGLMRKVTSGIYTFLPLGTRVLRRIEQIVREEMNRIGGQETLMPVLTPAELWHESGRWAVYGKELVRLTDRHGRSYALGPTHEEVVTDLIRGLIRSYRQLPVILYQIQTKFRDEVRPRFGVIRAREFVMKDAYSFHDSAESLSRVYTDMSNAYKRVFARCGLSVVEVQAESGAIGGDVNVEFMVPAETGESGMFTCPSCGYAASSDKAVTRMERMMEDPEDALEKVLTPNITTVEEVSAFLSVMPSRLIKTLLVETESEVVALLIPGDRDLNEAKLSKVTGSGAARLASAQKVQEVTGADVGFAGPIGLKGVRVIADYSLEGGKNFIVGANETDYHFRNANLGRDFTVDVYENLIAVQAEDPCPECGKGLAEARALEVGHVFKLGTKYSLSMNAKYLDRDGKEMPFLMGCYGLGVSRTVAAIVEQHHDKDGIIWPPTVSPFDVHVLPVNVDNDTVFATAQELHDRLEAAGVSVLMDDRNERAGTKFKDADLVGLPWRITVGEKFLTTQNVELRSRSTGQVTAVSVDEAVNQMARAVSQKAADGL